MSKLLQELIDLIIADKEHQKRYGSNSSQMILGFNRAILMLQEHGQEVIDKHTGRKPKIMMVTPPMFDNDRIKRMLEDTNQRQVDALCGKGGDPISDIRRAAEHIRSAGRRVPELPLGGTFATAFDESADIDKISKKKKSKDKRSGFKPKVQKFTASGKRRSW